MKRAADQPDRCVLLFEDESTFYRQPTQAWIWSSLGRLQPKMRYSHRSNTRMRMVGYLDAHTAAVHSEDMSRVSVDRLARSVARLSERHPNAEKIYLAWDNWPIHAHPKVLAALRRQPRVEVLWLPTYAPWLNPMEKGWRWGRQRVAHAHPWSDNFLEFRQRVRDEYAQLATPSEEFRRYVGLSS
jgi:transposase